MIIKFEAYNKTTNCKGKIINYNPKKIIDYNNKILVAKELTPLDAVFLLNIKGAIIENGSLLSHISIFMRENNKFLLKVKDISVLKDNCNVYINFDKNIIRW